VTPPEHDETVLTIWSEYHRSREPALRNRLVVQYSPLVKYVAGRMRSRLPHTVEQDDLVSDGVLGLMDAIERFDPARGLSFQTFAVPRIRGAIIDGLRAMDFVPRSVRDKVRIVQQAQHALEEKLGRLPEDEEVARELGVGVSQVRELTRQTSSAHANLDDFDLADELGSAAAETAVEQGDVNASLMRVIDELNERDQVVIALYYFEGLTLAEIGRVLGVTESRISQVHSRATALLRAKLVALDKS
jgi:RNA polymerase sigma factor for flagellar operon FliA